MTRDTKTAVTIFAASIVIACAVVVSGCSWWVHEIEDPVLSGGTWTGWTTTRPNQ